MSARSSSFDTLRWRDNQLQLLDQRLLPHSLRYQSCDSASAVASAIRDMVVRGAPAIGCAAAYGMALAAIHLVHSPAAAHAHRMEEAFELLASSRPTAVNLFWALSRMRTVWESINSAESHVLAARLLEEAHTICAEDVAANRRMGTHGAVLLNDGARILTHCNAGALATAGHGTALGVIRSAVEAGKHIQVYADETRPFLQGARLTAWELGADGIPVTLIADNAAGFLMNRGEIDAVLVGADRIAANGDVANKIGTFQLAVLAHHVGIPFYVAAPLSTFDSGIESGADIPIEERPAHEIRGWGEQCWAPDVVAVRNPVFDVTPASLVTALITDAGVIHSPNREKLERFLK